MLESGPKSNEKAHVGYFLSLKLEPVFDILTPVIVINISITNLYNITK
jgi:hypothetical protein